MSAAPEEIRRPPFSREEPKKNAPEELEAEKSAEEEWAAEESAGEEWELEESAEEEWAAEEAAEPEVGEGAAKLRHPLYDLDIERGSAPFNHVVELYRGVHVADTKEMRLTNIKYYPQVVNAFENKWGKIRYQFITNSNALVLTEDCHLFHIERTPDLASLEIIHQCDKLEIEACRLIKGQDLFSCLDMITESLSHLYSSLDQVNQKQKDEESHKNLVSYFAGELAEIWDHFIRCAKRRAVYEYYIGMMFGFGFVTAVALLMGIALDALLVSSPIVASFVGSLISGGLGAIVSVMQRMSSKDFNPDYEAGPEHNKRIGTFRPIIGAVMGIVVYFLMMSGLLPLAIPEDASKHIFYTLVIAFSSGFTERWAQGMLPPFAGNSTETGEGDQTSEEERGGEPPQSKEAAKPPKPEGAEGPPDEPVKPVDEKKSRAR